MARAKPTKTTAFHWKQWNLIEGAVQLLRANALAHVRHGISNRVLFDAFVRDEDKEMLTRVFTICNVVTSYQAVTYKAKVKDVEAEAIRASFDANFSFVINDKAEFKFLFPKYMVKATMLSPMPGLEEALHLITTINFEWKRVQEVLGALNSECTSPAAVKTLCPQLPGILITENTRELGERLSKLRNTENLPTLPLDLRKAAVSIGQTITKGLLLDKVEIPETEDDFRIILESAKSKTDRWDGKPWTL